jgi:lipopolysaccharide exporter
MQVVSGRMASSAAWMVGFRLFDRLLGVISTLVLARLLLPADFGLVAMAMAVFAALEVFGSFNFDLALVQREHPERRHFDTAWTYTVIVSVVSAMALCALAIPAAKFYHEPRVEFILYALALCAFLQGFENIGLVYFQKDLTLGKEVRFRSAKRMIGFAVTIPLAFVLRNYWALVIGIVVSRVSGVWLSYLMHPYRPRFSLAAGDDLFHFSKWMLVNNILLFSVVKGVDFIIGKSAGPAALGLYSVAYEISNLPTSELVMPIGRAVFPGYAMMAGNTDHLRDAYLKVLAVIAIFAVPAGAGIVVLAEPIVHVLLGERWLGAVPLIQWLALHGIIRACSSNIGSVYLALGKPRIVTQLGVLTVAILVPLLIWLTPLYGSLAAGWALLATSAVTVPPNFWILKRLIRLRLRSVHQAMWRPVVASSAMGLAIGAAHASFPFANRVADLFAYVLFGVAVYTLTTLLLWFSSGAPAGAERYLLQAVVDKIRGIRARRVRPAPN